MQPDTITLAVDEANNASTTDHVYTRFEEHLNRSVYICADHDPAARNLLGFYRTAPKINGNFKGVLKTSMKFTRDYTVVGVDGSDLSSPIIIEVNYSIPVGVAAADVVENRQTVLALLDTDTIMNNLNRIQMV
jgi:hypothetical protein